MKPTRLLFTAVAFAAACISLAADPEVEELLAKMRKAYSGIETAKFAVDGTVTTPMGEQTFTLTGTYKDLNQVRATFDLAGQKLEIYSTGKEVVMTGGPEGERLVDADYSHDAINQVIQANLEILNLWDWERQLTTTEGGNMHESELKIKKDVIWNDRKWIVLQESAPQASLYVEYYIDPKTNLIGRTIVHTLEDHVPLGDYKVTKWETGMKVDDKIFVPPVITR